MKLDQVKAIITGGASGLGHAVAQHLAKAGAAISLFDVNQEKGEAAARALGAKARFARVDVTDEAAVSAAVAAAAEAMGGLNVAINCAGVLGAGRVLGKEGPMALSQFETTVRINLVGSFNVAKAAAAQMQGNEPGEDGERGVVIHTASIAAYEGQIGQAAYSASKGGVVGMTLPMAREFARIGVRVMTVAPGVFHTPMVDGMPQAVYDSLCAQVPYPSRLGRGEEFADTVAFILGNRYLNGSVIRVDGAVRLAPK
ncbi:SDR family NAD(P)-dependent oxidoreductase [Pseudomarimonas salicorniae]|uniref:SDR family NAD(P)-dependent oxidoreductase n=1 Tax=Pseudomarimonas salicorniae TaxID=2933270 RepID=A0ABT0GF12_9GAMM|nr:SDR family NAD(P)-dependent oxidoreductase [Lysobacter sp. CAU 1642]MCK7593134.1 SDR family NAD(P)-dependent oxidoreductase [Lysobacter sp. CAU 1642]